MARREQRREQHPLGERPVLFGNGDGKLGKRVDQRNDRRTFLGILGEPVSGCHFPFLLPRRSCRNLSPPTVSTTRRDTSPGKTISRPRRETGNGSPKRMRRPPLNGPANRAGGRSREEADGRAAQSDAANQADHETDVAGMAAQPMTQMTGRRPRA